LYHVWFSTKWRKRLLAGDIEIQAKRLLKCIAADKGIDLRRCETMVDHVHLMLSARADELSRQVKLLKGISARGLFQEFPDIKLDARTDHFWQRGFGYRELEGSEARRVAWYVGTQKWRPGKYER
jgi:putative transposase